MLEENKQTGQAVERPKGASYKAQMDHKEAEKEFFKIFPQRTGSTAIDLYCKNLENLHAAEVKISQEWLNAIKQTLGRKLP